MGISCTWIIYENKVCTPYQKHGMFYILFCIYFSDVHNIMLLIFFSDLKLQKLNFFERYYYYNILPIYNFREKN